MTKVIIEPYGPDQNESFLSEEKPIRFDEWIDCFQVELVENSTIGCDDYLNRCSNLTKIEINNSNDNATKLRNKYLASITVVKSPMQSLKPKESSTASTRKFLNTIENSYPDNYLSIQDSNNVVYALLDTVNYEPCLSPYDLHVKPKLKMSKFLRQQLKLFDINPKVLVKAYSIESQKSKSILSNTSLKYIKLMTNYPKDVNFEILFF